MYVPSWFREERLAAQHALMRSYPFAALVSEVDGAPFASHVPFSLDPVRGPCGTLRAHVARSNPHWRSFDAGREALVIFQGPHAYVSPTWYTDRPAVPTWNYAAVHAYGIPRLLDGEPLGTLLRELVAEFEAPDSGLDLADEYVEQMARGVVGFEIEIGRIEGKVKMGQNRSSADRHAVVRALAASERNGDRELAEWMRANLPEAEGR
ncbi:MAG TPA: FMN-binding negative transcriptional regulator [Chthonomonadaceae bacterium]|nr:FMN-binding negative transcriptional regulator [Chthonomonadaceae bacterium]